MLRPMQQPRETLIAQLRARGVTYLAPSDAVATEAIPSDAALLVALVEQADARLQLALIPLLLRHPELAACVCMVGRQSDQKLSLELHQPIA